MSRSGRQQSATMGASLGANVERISVEEGLAIREGRIERSSDPVWDIPVLFQARAKTEDEAAELVGQVLGDAEVMSDNWIEEGDGREIESWFFPNHKQVDGNDIPVTVILHVDEEKMAERRKIVSDITAIIEEVDICDCTNEELEAGKHCSRSWCPNA